MCIRDSTEAQIREMEDYAVNQNLTTLRNRVNELGVSEPLIQKQGRNRIVVELPGVLDTAEAKRILGKPANLEFRLEARFDDEGGSGKEEFEFRNPGPGERRAWLERDIIIAGDRVTSAQSNYDENGRPQVNIGLDSQGGTMMNRATRDNIKRRMGVLFIERKSRTIGYEKDADGYETPITEKYEEKKIISLATIQSALGTQFRITGLDSPAEAAELALLLRAGALAAPLDFVEERTVGPSLGADNIALGLRSIQIGSLLVIGFMLLVYRVFGIFAILALGFNVMLLLSLMSMLSATLTLPGMAGIVLTIGMAVDANVLINSRIREELANGLTPHAAIHAGYERAFLTIIDSNLTTLLIAVIPYAVGTGPVGGFAGGETPNPCLKCNRQFRWTFLLNHTLALGAEFMATGHYVRIKAEGGKQKLLRAVDHSKDQSYVLHVLKQDQLAHALFPVGEFPKPEIRRIAADFGLPTASRADSQDLCFLAGEDYRGFLQRLSLIHISEPTRPY